MDRIIEQVRNGKVLICDGAWGTELFKLGLNPGDCPEMWNIDFPDRVQQVAASYVCSGADIIETNSFGGSSVKLASYHLDLRAYEINRAAAEISRNAAGPDVHVAGSIGPSGKMLIMGEITEQELYDSFATQAKALQDGGADTALIETMIDMAELSIAVRAVKENSTLEIIATASYDKTPSGFRTMMGASIADMAGSAIREGASIIGANCGYGSDMMVEIVAEIHRQFPDTPILVQPNAGLPIIAENGSLFYPETPEFMASRVPALISAGASIIGGCCGTSPEHIRATSKLIRAIPCP